MSLPWGLATPWDRTQPWFHHHTVLVISENRILLFYLNVSPLKDNEACLEFQLGDGGVRPAGGVRTPAQRPPAPPLQSGFADGPAATPATARTGAGRAAARSCPEPGGHGPQGVGLAESRCPSGPPRCTCSARGLSHLLSRVGGPEKSPPAATCLPAHPDWGSGGAGSPCPPSR